MHHDVPTITTIEERINKIAAARRHARRGRECIVNRSTTETSVVLLGVREDEMFHRSVSAVDGKSRKKKKEEDVNNRINTCQ